MRLLYATATTLDAQSEESQRIEALASELSSAGHSMTLLAPGNFAPPEVRRVRSPSSGLGSQTALSILLSKELVRNRPTHIYLGASIFLSALPVLLLGSGIPTIVELSLDVLRQLDTSTPGAKEVVRHRQIRGLVAKAAEAVTFEEQAVDLGHKLGFGSIKLIAPTRVDALPTLTSKEARARLGLPEDLRLVSLVGSLGPELRLDVLADAHRRLTGTGLLVMGNGPQARFVEAMTMTARPSTPVLLSTDRPRSDEVLAVAAADVCLSLADGESERTARLALAMGTRVVWGSNRPPPSELAALYPEHEVLLSASPTSTDDLASALSACLDIEKSEGALPPDAVSHARLRIEEEGMGNELLTLLERISSG